MIVTPNHSVILKKLYEIEGIRNRNGDYAKLDWGRQVFTLCMVMLSQFYKKRADLSHSPSLDERNLRDMFGELSSVVPFRNKVGRYLLFIAPFVIEPFLLMLRTLNSIDNSLLLHFIISGISFCKWN